MAWPPLCPECRTQHRNSCEDSQEARQVVAATIALLKRHTPTLPIPETLRGPKWSGVEVR